MERPLPFQPADSRHPSGWLLSLGLHLIVLLAALWYAHARPDVPRLPAFLPVELVAAAPAPGPVGTAPAPRQGASAPRPATAPRPVQGARPDAATPPVDELSAKLQGLARLHGADGPLGLDNGGGNGTGSGGGALSLRDFIRAQIMRRWLPDMGTSRVRTVTLRVTVTNRGVIRTAEILIQPAGDQGRELALSARNAAILSSPVTMPPGTWPAVSVLDMTMSPRDASR